MFQAARFPWLLIGLIAACAPRAPEMAIDKPVCVACKALETYRGAIGLGNVTYSSNIKGKLKEAEISYDEFRESLRKSLAISKVLSVGSSGGSYTLDVQILDIHRPKIGFTMISYIIVRYRLQDVRNGGLAREFVIRSEKTLRFSDSIVVLNRSRLSIEGAIRGNIETFLTRLLTE